MSLSAYTVLVAAPPTLYRQGLLTILHDTWPDLAVTVTPDARAVPVLLRQQSFDLVVLDNSLDKAALLELVGQLRRVRHGQPLLVLAEPPRPYPAALADAHTALLPDRITPHELIAALQHWLSGITGGAQAARLQQPPTPLSRREREVLRLVIDDCNNEEIAQQLCLSVRTVESHRRALLQKTGARSVVGLVAQAVRAGWANP